MGFIKMLVKRVLLLMVIYQACRLLFWAFNKSYFDGIAFSELFSLLRGSIRFDLSILMYLNCVYILMFILPFNFRYNKVYQAIAKFLFLFANGVGILANLIDCAYFPFILRRTNASFFLEFGNDTHLLYSVDKFIASYWFVTIIIVVFIGFLIKSYKYISMPERKPFSWKIFAIDLLMFPLVGGVWLGIARGSFVP